MRSPLVDLFNLHIPNMGITFCSVLLMLMNNVYFSNAKGQAAIPPSSTFILV